MSAVDVAVVGGGPAGAASAIFLARQGYAVTLLDRARFPRDKVCGEFISPAADALLNEMGVLAAIEARRPLRLKGIFLAAHGERPLWVDYPPERPGGSPMSSLSVPRLDLDGLLLQRARAVGVQVREGFAVTDFRVRDGAAVGVAGKDDAGAGFEIAARLVIDAGGRNCLAIRRFGLRKKRGGKRGKIALAAHWRGGRRFAPYCYMHIQPPGYTGIAPTGEGEANVVLVVEGGALKGKDPEEFYRRTVLADPSRRALLEGAAPMEKVRAVDSLAYAVRMAPIGGLMLVGDAMGFMDPFTGEGIYLSLRSAKIAAEAAGQALAGRVSSRQAIDEYRERRLREFRWKFAISRVLEGLIERPAPCRWVMRALGARPALAEDLVGVIGDYFPARKVASAGFLLRLLGVAAVSAFAPAESGGTRPEKIPAGSPES